MQINYPELDEDEKEPNRTNYYKGLYNKRKERHQDLKKAIKDEGYSVTGSDDELTKKGSTQETDDLVITP